MISNKTRLALAALLASAVTVASAAGGDHHSYMLSNAQAGDATFAAQRATPKQIAQFEFLEHQREMLSAPGYDPSEHPNAKPASHSAHLPPPVFDDPMNTRSPG